jgi:menaquinone-dependent protoporphyrinogen oxidase
METSDRAVLVAYETRFGSTAEVASAIAEVLRTSGNIVDVRRASDVLDPSGYAAVIVGAPVYSRRWLRAACRWVSRHAPVLRERPLWFFALGIRVPDGPHASARHTLRLMRRFHQLAPDVVPRDVALFAGSVNPAIVGIREQIQLRIFRPQTGDFRDWAKIRAWAERIGNEMDRSPRAAERSVTSQP